MAKKNIQVIYTVNDQALIKSAATIKSNEEAAKKADDAVKKYGKDAQKAGEDASKSFLNLKNVWSGLVAVGITSFFVNLAKKTFELGVQQEQLNIAFTTFLGSAEKAKKLLGDLTKFAIVTPFTPDQVNNAAKALLAFGVAGRDIIPTLKMLGDVSSGTGKDLTEMAIIFGQIRSTGRLMGQDLLQLINAGFNPLQIISEKTGKSVGTLKAEMEKGLITFDMVSDAFKSATEEGGRFFNLMEKQSQSVGGLLSTVSGNLDEVLKNIFTANTGRVNAFVQMLVKASEGFLEFSLTADQALDKLNKKDQSAFIQKLLNDYDQFASKESTLQEFINATNKALNEEYDLQQKQHNQALLSKDDTEEEQKYRLNNLRIIKQQIIAIQDYVREKKEETDSAQNKKLTTQLEGEIALRKKLAEAYHKYAEEFVKQPIKEADQEAGFGVGNLINPPPIDEAKMQELEKSGDLVLAELKRQYDERLQAQMDAAKAEVEAEDNKEQQKRDLRQKSFDYGLNLLQQLLMASIQTSDATFQKEKENFDQRLANVGDNERARMEIEAERAKFEKDQADKQEQFEIERAKREKERQVKQMIIQNFLNAIRALGTPPVPNFAAAGIAGAFGLAQVVAAKALGFKDGVIGLDGPGTGTSDSIPARLSRGESVITARATERSHNLLEAINDGRIDDRILRKIQVSGSSVTLNNDYKGLIEEMRGERIRRYEEGYFTMNEIQRANGFKTKIKSKYRS